MAVLERPSYECGRSRRWARSSSVPGVQGRWEYMRPAVEALAEHFRVITFLALPRTRQARCDPRGKISTLRRSGRGGAERPRPVVGDHLRRFVWRIDRLEIRRAASGADLEAGPGLDPGPGWRLNGGTRFYARLPALRSGVSGRDAVAPARRTAAAIPTRRRGGRFRARAAAHARGSAAVAVPAGGSRPPYRSHGCRRRMPPDQRPDTGCHGEAALDHVVSPRRDVGLRDARSRARGPSSSRVRASGRGDEPRPLSCRRNFAVP